MQEHAYTAVLSSLSLLGICYLIYWKYKNFRVDAFRQEMFELRDSFFDAASDGLVPFSHPSYGVLRSTMNGFIRFGHRISLWQVILFRAMRRGEPTPKETSFDESWKRSTEGLDDIAKEKLNAYRERMESLVFKHALLASPELYLPIVLFVFAAVLKAIGKGIISLLEKKRKESTAGKQFFPLQVLQNQMQSIDDTAYIYGKLA